MDNSLQSPLRCESVLPYDCHDATLLGRIWQADVDGPTPVLYHNGMLLDVSCIASTMSALLEMDDLLEQLHNKERFVELGSLDDVVGNTAFFSRDINKNYLLSPFDLQAIKASGVTFAASMLERVIEERAGGDNARAEALRKEIMAVIGDELSAIQPGSESALELKNILIEKGVWSQYLEVGIGPFAEIFSKSQPLSTVGLGSEVGLHSASEWNNPEPEIVLAVNSSARIVGAALGNDVNLRDIEGRSALLLGKAKDNNASCSIGPFIRLFDGKFTLADIEMAEIALSVEGEDNFVMKGSSSMSKISRSPESLVKQTIGNFHQYPDGFALFLGTMFAPVDDRGEKGKGFTHNKGDKVTISTPLLGALVNWVNRSEAITPWSFGARALMNNLAKRGLLG